MSCCDCSCDTIGSTCANPCSVSSTNTAACETIASQIENFTEQFFGEVEKTEVDGNVEWVLPCGLEIGLENNPRMAGEGLACYFLRLFNDGIIGATGPQGVAGANGDDGLNAFTVTLQSFAQPSSGSPNIQVLTSYNTCMVVGLYVFIVASGWYQVTATDQNGNVWLTLQQALAGAPSTIPAGSLVIPSGTPGVSVVGPTGPAGPQGLQGVPGASYTTSNEFYYATVGTDYLMQVLYAAVNFVNSSPEVTLDTAGTYLITVVANITAQAGILDTDTIFCKLYDVTAAADVPGSVQSIRGLIEESISQVVINVRYQAPANNTTVALYAKMDTADKAAVTALATTITAIRLE